jgi:hypothetical protein
MLEVSYTLTVIRWVIGELAMYPVSYIISKASTTPSYLYIKQLRPKIIFTGILLL